MAYATNLLHLSCATNTGPEIACVFKIGRDQWLKVGLPWLVMANFLDTQK